MHFAYRIFIRIHCVNVFLVFRHRSYWTMNANRKTKTNDCDSINNAPRNVLTVSSVSSNEWMLRPNILNFYQLYVCLKLPYRKRSGLSVYSSACRCNFTRFVRIERTHFAQSTPVIQSVLVFVYESARKTCTANYESSAATRSKLNKRKK